MKINIAEIAPYGRFFSNSDNNTEWWLNKQDFTVYDDETLYSTFGYENRQELIESECFLPLFKTDIIALQKEYAAKNFLNIEKYYSAGIEQWGYDFAFRRFIECTMYENDWYEEEEKQLCADAIRWCKENSLPYFYKKKTDMAW